MDARLRSLERTARTDPAALEALGAARARLEPGPEPWSADPARDPIVRLLASTIRVRPRRGGFLSIKPSLGFTVIEGRYVNARLTKHIHWRRMFYEEQSARGRTLGSINRLRHIRGLPHRHIPNTGWGNN